MEIETLEFVFMGAKIIILAIRLVEPVIRLAQRHLSITTGIISEIDVCSVIFFLFRLYCWLLCLIFKSVMCYSMFIGILSKQNFLCMLKMSF